MSMFLKSNLLLFVIFFLVCLTNAQNGCLRIKELTTSQNQHTQQLIAIKMTSDYKTVVSLGIVGQIKVWSFLFNKLTLKQEWVIKENFIYSNQLFLWNDGEKIFLGGISGYIKIYNFLSTVGQYDIVNYQNFSVRINYNSSQMVDSIYVNKQGNQMFVGRVSTGIGRFIYNGERWVDQTPQILIKQIGNLNFKSDVTSLFKTKNQEKLMISYYDTSSYPNLQRYLKIFVYNGSNYNLNQAFSIPSDPFWNSDCKLTEDDGFIVCYGSKISKFVFKFDARSNQYVNVSDKTKKDTKIQDAYLDSNEILTQVNRQNSTIFRYRCDLKPENPTYQLIDQVVMPDPDFFPYVIASQRQSKFQLIGATNQYELPENGKIFLLSCYQSSQQDNSFQRNDLRLQVA